jgi:predicted acetyltransferase
LGGFRENSLENYSNCAAGIFIYTMRFSNQLPPMSVHVSLATAAERTPLFRMLELYQHDLSDIWDQDVDAAGEFGYGLDRYWSEAGNWPYVFRVNNHFAGFTLVDTRVKLPNGDFWMDQFFVMKKYRGRGVGAQAAKAVFDLHAGRWQVGQMPNNHAARTFWRNTIGAYTHSNFEEHAITEGWWQGSVQRFRSPTR